VRAAGFLDSVADCGVKGDKMNLVGNVISVCFYDFSYCALQRGCAKPPLLPKKPFCSHGNVPLGVLKRFLNDSKRKSLEPNLPIFPIFPLQL
jgi:hypothetical protein